jgi:hypothetical protein
MPCSVPAAGHGVKPDWGATAWKAAWRRWIAQATESDSNRAMFIAILLVLAGIGFYAFIGTAPQEAVKVRLVLFWGIIIVAGFLAEFFY